MKELNIKLISSFLTSCSLIFCPTQTDFKEFEICSVLLPNKHVRVFPLIDIDNPKLSVRERSNISSHLFLDASLFLTLLLTLCRSFCCCRKFNFALTFSPEILFLSREEIFSSFKTCSYLNRNLLFT